MGLKMCLTIWNIPITDSYIHGVIFVITYVTYNLIMDPHFWDEGNFNKNRDQEVAQMVGTNRIKNQQQIYTLHGEKSKSKKQLDHYKDQTSFGNDSELYTKAGTSIVIDGSMERSYCLDGLNRNTVVFKNKIKHVMVRNCDDTRIYIQGGTIGGIDVLFGSNVSIRTPKHNFTNVELSQHTQLGGTVDSDSLIHVFQSLDVFVNHKNLMVNPFSTKPLKMVYKTNDTQDRLDIGEMSKSPTGDSTSERWQTQLMLIGRDISNEESETDSGVTDTRETSYNTD